MIIQFINLSDDIELLHYYQSETFYYLKRGLINFFNSILLKFLKHFFLLILRKKMNYFLNLYYYLTSHFSCSKVENLNKVKIIDL